MWVCVFMHWKKKSFLNYVFKWFKTLRYFHLSWYHENLKKYFIKPLNFPSAPCIKFTKLQKVLHTRSGLNPVPFFAHTITWMLIKILHPSMHECWWWRTHLKDVKDSLCTVGEAACIDCGWLGALPPNPTDCHCGSCNLILEEINLVHFPGAHFISGEWRVIYYF